MKNESGLIPVEFYCVVDIGAVEERSAGGIILVQDTQDREALKTEEGTLVAASPLAFTYDHWPEGSQKPEVGNTVLFKRHAGLLRERNGRKFRLLNDKEIIAIVDQPQAVAVAA